MAFIAEKCSITLKRAERAVSDLVKAGLVTVHPICEKLSDTFYKGYAAIRTISAKLFTIFGLSGRLKYERDKSAARQRKKTQKESLKAKAKIDLIIGNHDKAPQNIISQTRSSELRNIRDILNSS